MLLIFLYIYFAWMERFCLISKYLRKYGYLQSPLVEYDFRLTDVLQDLQDGVRLCRVIQLLKQDSSIMMVRFMINLIFSHSFIILKKITSRL